MENKAGVCSSQPSDIIGISRVNLVVFNHFNDPVGEADFDRLGIRAFRTALQYWEFIDSYRAVNNIRVALSF